MLSTAGEQCWGSGRRELPSCGRAADPAPHPSALGTTVLPPRGLLRPPRTTGALSRVRHSLYFQKTLEITRPVSDKVQTRNQTSGL